MSIQKPQSPPAPPDKQPPHVKVPEPPERTVGFAVVGLGQLAIEEVLPAFANCKLARPVALISGHPEKAKKLAKVYDIDPKNIYSYETYEKLAHNPAIDAVYIILPNSMHADFTIRGLKAGKHVLCEKPMAGNVTECSAMIAAAKTAKRKLMIAYRLRHEPFNMKAIELCRSNVGGLKTITSSNCQSIKAPNIRLSKALAGGPLQDVGVYCINAFRYLSGEEPVEVSASSFQPDDDPRFSEVPQTVAFTLKFPSGLIAAGVCSFGTGKGRQYRVYGTKGMLELDSAFDYHGQQLTIDTGDESTEFKFDPVNHFSAEMDHFAECILSDKDPRTPGEEGLADMRIIAAIEEAARSGKTVSIGKAL